MTLIIHCIGHSSETKGQFWKKTIPLGLQKSKDDVRPYRDNLVIQNATCVASTQPHY